MNVQEAEHGGQNVEAGGQGGGHAGGDPGREAEDGRHPAHCTENQYPVPCPRLWPPSYVVPFPQRKCPLLPPWPRPWSSSRAPLSLVNTTSVSEYSLNIVKIERGSYRQDLSHPASCSCPSTSPTAQSISATESP